MRENSKSQELTGSLGEQVCEVVHYRCRYYWLLSD